MNVNAFLRQCAEQSKRPAHEIIARPIDTAVEVMRQELVTTPPRSFSTNSTPTVRQAGTTEVAAHSELIDDFRKLAESQLYFFAKGVMGMTLLTEELHRPMCDDLQRCPPRRKLTLFPRDHLKTSVVGRSLGPHMLVQPKTNNLYFPGCQDKVCRHNRVLTKAACSVPEHRFAGCDSRILLGYETATNAESQLRWIEGQWENNELLRALWPHRVWESASKQSAAWNAKKMIIPRDHDYPEPSIDTVGVDGAVTGRHYNAHVFDDLCTLEAANSAVVMESTIQWFIASRALLDDPTHSLEFIIGTRWAVWDLYQYILDNDPTVEVRIRSVVEDGKPIFPQVFTPEVIEQKRKQFGSLFPLLYMNSAVDAAITDFDLTCLRLFTPVEGKAIEFENHEYDEILARDLLSTTKPPAPPHEGFIPLSEYVKQLDEHDRDSFLRARYAQFHAA